MDSPLNHLTFTSAAAREYRGSRNYYRLHANSEVVAKFVASVNETIHRCRRTPRLGLKYGIDEFRWVKVPRFPYLLIYELTQKDEIVVVAFAHQRRSPGYWLNR